MRAASVMKKLSEMLTAGGAEPRVDQCVRHRVALVSRIGDDYSRVCVWGCRYLFLFLKFMQAAIPTMEYDFTMSVGR